MVTADETEYELDDLDPASGASTAIATAVSNIANEDWEAIYASLHPTISGSITEGEFVDGLETAFGAQGELTSVVTVGSPSLSGNDAGWDIAHSEIAITVSKDQCEATYDSGIDLVFDDGWKIGNLRID